MTRSSSYGRRAGASMARPSQAANQQEGFPKAAELTCFVFFLMEKQQSLHTGGEEEMGKFQPYPCWFGASNSRKMSILSEGGMDFPMCLQIQRSCLSDITDILIRTQGEAIAPVLAEDGDYLPWPCTDKNLPRCSSQRGCFMLAPW